MEILYPKETKEVLLYLSENCFLKSLASPTAFRIKRILNGRGYHNISKEVEDTIYRQLRLMRVDGLKIIVDSDFEEDNTVAISQAGKRIIDELRSKGTK